MASGLEILIAKRELAKVIERESHEVKKGTSRLERLYEAERMQRRLNTTEGAIAGTHRSKINRSLFFCDHEQQVSGVICGLYQNGLPPEQWEVADAKGRIQSLQKARELILQENIRPSVGNGEAMAKLLDKDFVANSDASIAYAKLYQVLSQETPNFPVEARLSERNQKLWADIEEDYTSILERGFEKSYKDFDSEAVARKELSVEPHREANSLAEKLAEFPRIDNRQTLEQTLKECNPNYKKDRCWKINCQRCVPTYEMRARGYDVTAKPRLFEIDYLAFQPFEVWENAEIHSTHGNGIAEIEDFLRKNGDGTRVQIIAINRFGSGGHTLVGQINDGVVSFIDPQDGNTDMRRYFTYVKPDSVKFCRIDNAKVSSLILDCCEGVKRV